MRISVIAHPNARHPRVEKDLMGTLHVYVHAPPLEGKANAAVIDALAQYLGKKRGCIILSSGGRSKRKTFEVLT